MTYPDYPVPPPDPSAGASLTPLGTVRAGFYLLISGLIWLVEGFLFSRFLHFSLWQTGVLAVLYLTLLGLAVRYLWRSIQEGPASDSGLPAWRVVTVLPMLVVILGSFASLPIILGVALLGKL